VDETVTVHRASAWFPYGTDNDRLQLFCLPAAGGAASGFHPWRAAFGPGIDVVPVQLPGREARLDEEPIASVPELVAALVGPMLEHAGERFALFGHCMGALVTYELAHALTEAGRPPAHLIVSAHMPPALMPLPRKRLRPDTMSDVELGEFLATQAGAPREILDLPEIMELLIPAVRADLALCQSYQDTSRPPLPVPITAFGASAEREITAHVLARWADLTSAGFRMKILPGGHDYIYQDVPAMAEALNATLLEAVR
jgi:surfactin synthase thioesterase subunit